MAGHAWLNPEERNTLIRALINGTAWADAALLVTGTATNKVDATFCDTQQVPLEAIATARAAETRPGPAAREALYAAAAVPTFTGLTNRFTMASAGDAGGSETCDIVGTNINDPDVTIGGHAQTVLHWSPTHIVIKTVAHAAEANLHVVITNRGGGSVDSGAVFAFVAGVDPTFTSITPATGPLTGDTPCRIVGTLFREGVTVKFGSTSALVTAVSPTVIQCRAPAHAAGATNVVITNLNSETVTGAGAYTYA